MNLETRKGEARKAAFQRRKIAHAADRGYGDVNLRSVLSQHRGYPLAGYLPIRTEIDPRPAMAEAARHGPVAVPVIQGEAQPLKFSRWTPDIPLKEGPFGAMVPVVDDFIEPQILIVPLVAFDDDGGRLGYGGGFYDRTIEQLLTRVKLWTIGFAYEAQFDPFLPLEPTDQPLDMIVTDRNVHIP